MPLDTQNNASHGYQGITFENMLRSSVTCGVITIDAAGTVTSLTAEAGRALKLSPGKQPLTLHDLPAPLQAVIREVQSSGQPADNREMVLPLGERMVTFTVNAAPSLLEAAAVVISLKDDSSLAKLEQNLRRLDRLASVGTLSASMAHEIKNALVAVRTFSELLLEKNPDAELAEIVRREIGRVDLIATQMLQLSAPIEPNFSAVPVHKLLHHSLRLVQQGTLNKSISFRSDFRAEPDMLHGDDHQLEQAFLNLLFNAVEAMPSRGVLTVSTDLVMEEASDQLREQLSAAKLIRIRITDTGTGIDPAQLNHIFEPFFTTKENGTGLGLAITRRIVGEHGGAIHVEPSSGPGATFVILLPVRSNA